MKQISCLLLLLLVTSGSLRAQAPVPDDEALIRSAEARAHHALVCGDTLALRAVWHEKLTVNNPLGHVARRPEVLERVKQGLIRYTAQEVTVEALWIDGDLAFVMGAETVRPTGNAPLAGQTVHRRFTNVWQRSAGAWRMIARHANVVPPR